MARAVFYSLGGGLGHLNRCLAVIRHLRRSAPHTEPLILTNSPYAQLALTSGVPVVRVPTHFEQDLFGHPDLAWSLTRPVLEALGPPDVLVVDALPEQLSPALLRFLRGTRFLKVLVHRHEGPLLLDDRVEAFDLCFYPYPAVQAPRELGPFRPSGYIVSRQPQDVLTRQQARLRLGLSAEGDEPVILAFHACSPAETMAMFRQVKAASDQLDLGHSLRFSTPQVLPGVEYFYPHLVAIYPIMDVMTAADLLVCAGGYNAVAEVGCLGGRALFRPQDRPHDPQRDRVDGAPVFGAATGEEALAAQMRELLAAPPPPRRPAEDFHGAEVVAEAIANGLYAKTMLV